MKKVGIITFHHYYNYGTVLQAYALQRIISSIPGYIAEIIDFISYEETQIKGWRLLLLRIKRLPVYVLEWKRVRKTLKYSGLLSEKEQSFDDFFKNYLVTSNNRYNTYQSLKDNVTDYDVLVTGSDQTWSPKIGFHPAMFLEFGKPQALRIAYAPSIGVSHLNKRESEYLNIHLQPYEALSCRERIGTELLRSVVKGKKIVNVLDPTLLLTSNEWNEIAVTPDIKGDYILCYFIGERTYYRDIACQLAQDLDLPMFFIPVCWQDTGKGYNLLPKAGPKEFLGLIRQARLVLTDSFHGTIFSINYRKSFYSFTKIEGGKSALDNSRLYDVLSKLNLDDRLYDRPCKIAFTDVNYTRVNDILNTERQKSFDYLQDALIDKRICAHEECTGCMACESACSHLAISIEKDGMGFAYPKKNLEKCLNCGMCTIVCPNNSVPKYHSTEKAYIATAVDTRERQSSTSGGLASVMARYVINHGGVVYGCTSMDATHVRHIRIVKNEEISQLKGSKYVQSDMQGVMSLVKEDLKNGVNVLYIGTPCQVAGLNGFLRKKYENLYTVDFVCHGVPSQQLLNDIIALDYDNLKLTKIIFRFKDDNGQSSYGIKLMNENGYCVFKEKYPKSRYIAGFLGGMYYRESCYQCHYARIERVSDVTIGDYWDREKKYEMVGENGLSMLMINTDSGQKLLDAILPLLHIQPIKVEYLKDCNTQLRKPFIKNKSYSAFKFEYMNNGINAAAIDIIDREIRRIRQNKFIGSITDQVKSNNIGVKIINIIRRFK